MPTTIKKGLLCRDGEFENGLYPYTQMDCVFDSNNSTTLDVVVDDIKENLIYVDELGAYGNVVPINADQLEGHDAAYFEGLIPRTEATANLIAIQSNTTNANFTAIAHRNYGSVVQARFEFQTKRELTAGNSYVLGTMSGAVPSIITHAPTFRQDSGLHGG